MSASALESGRQVFKRIAVSAPLTIGTRGVRGVAAHAGTINCIRSEEYEELCRRVEAVVREATTPGSVVAVVSKGDPQLIEIEGRLGLHFPRDTEGRYAGHYPKTSEEAVGQVESLRRDGAQFLCLPSTASWWLDHYQGLAGWLEAHCRIAAEQPGTCILYDLLRPPGVSAEATAVASSQVRSLLGALLPEEAVLFVVGAAADDYSAPGRQVTPLGTSHAVGLRHLAAPEVDRPTFVLVARDGSAPPLNEAMEGFLARRTEPVARRENLCDVLRVKAASRNRSRIDAPDRGEAGLRASRGSSLQGEWAQKLSGRLERLGLAGEDSSGGSGSPIT